MNKNMHQALHGRVQVCGCQPSTPQHAPPLDSSLPALTQGNPEIAVLNEVRSSLGALAVRSVGYSLPQPHLERARLCELAGVRVCVCVVALMHACWGGVRTSYGRIDVQAGRQIM